MTATLSPQGYTYDFQGLQDLWIANGGNPVKAPVMAAVAMAESGGHSWEVSKWNDWGVWQINNGGQAMLDPNANAKRAIQMSNNGENVKAWCTAYGNPNADCGHGGPSYLAANSPIWKYLTGAQAKAAGLTANAPAGAGSATATLISSTSGDTSTGSTSGDTSGQDHCLLKMPITGDCLLSTSNARAIGGVLCISAGVAISLVGIVLLAGKEVGSITGYLPGSSTKQAAQATGQQQALAERRQDLAEQRFERGRLKTAPGSNVGGRRMMGRSKGFPGDSSSDFGESAA